MYIYFCFSVFIIEDDCLLLKEHPNSVTPVGPFICPNVLLDTCGADAVSIIIISNNN